MDPSWRRWHLSARVFTPYRESLRITLTRTITIAVVVGGVLALSWRGPGSLATRWAVASILVLWPAVGGHLVELWFLNWLRPRLGDRRPVQTVARLAVWFVAGVALGIAMWLTGAALIGRIFRAYPLWWAGIGFIGVELVAHLGLQLAGRPSFLNGRG